MLDGELYSGEGMDGIDGILTARQQSGSPVAFGAFDVLALDGQAVMPEPWTDRRNRLEDVFADFRTRWVGLVLVETDARALWAMWVEQYARHGGGRAYPSWSS